MIDFLGSLICKWKGHKFGRPVTVKVDGVHFHQKQCRRCALVAPVKRRVPK